MNCGDDSIGPLKHTLERGVHRSVVTTFLRLGQAVCRLARITGPRCNPFDPIAIRELRQNFEKLRKAPTPNYPLF